LRRIILCAAVSICLRPVKVVAQAVAATVAQAEAEAIGFPRFSATVPRQPFFADKPFAGTSDRRCVPSSTDDPQASGSLRSGDMIVRGRLSGPSGLQAGKEHKILWLPLHGDRTRRIDLVLRATRIGHPADSLRRTIPGIVTGGGGRMNGYPSSVSFPSAGQWLVVATAGDDWGCFVLDVLDAKVSTRS
jgi:hypothetical protein